MNKKRLKSGEAQTRVLELVRDPHASFADASLAYRRMLQIHGRYDWSDVNGEIIDRWGEEGWMRMMRVAWTKGLDSE